MRADGLKNVCKYCAREADTFARRQRKRVHGEIITVDDTRTENIKKLQDMRTKTASIRPGNNKRLQDIYRKQLDYAYYKKKEGLFV
jgi:hypothetical protein